MMKKELNRYKQVSKIRQIWVGCELKKSLPSQRQTYITMYVYKTK